MNILVTGAKGMVGTALVNNLKNIRDNKNRTRPDIKIETYRWKGSMEFSIILQMTADLRNLRNQES